MNLTLAECAAIPTAEVLSSVGGERFTRAAIDSRTCTGGELFFAIRAARDGHEFAAAAVRAGARGVVVEHAVDGLGTATVIRVADARLALGELGAGRRRRHATIPTVGVTGSSGKTTTKELITAILSAAAGSPDGVLATEGNLNNDLGVPLTLLRLDERHRFAVIEMGMSARGEIAYLARLAAPDVGIITLVAPAHLEHLKSLDEIARAKGELLSGLKPGGIAVLPDDDARLQHEADAAGIPPERRLLFGESPSAAVRVVSTTPRGAEGQSVRLSLRGQELAVELRLVGRHNARNAAAAAAAALALGVSPAHIAAGLAKARPARHRSELATAQGRNVLADLYNANPASTSAALRTLAEIAGSARRVAILGDMLELGPDSPALHAEVGAVAARIDPALLICIGALGRQIAAGARAAGLASDRILETDDRAVAARAALAATTAGDFVLIKGSRGMKLEEVLSLLTGTPTGGGH